MDEIKGIATKITKNKQQALLKFAYDLHQHGIVDKSIPVDTGYLSQESGSVKTVGMANVEITYATDYAQYVWYGNKTGVAQWTFRDFRDNRTKLLQDFTKNLFKDKL